MPMPITIEMNMTEKSERCPITSVAMPIAQQRLIASTASIKSGLPTRRNAISSNVNVSANATIVASSLSWNAAVISSFDSAAFPVTPTRTLGNSRRSSAMTERIPSIARRSPVNEPCWLSGAARTKSRRWSSDTKNPAVASAGPSTEKSPPHGDLYGAPGRSSRCDIWLARSRMKRRSRPPFSASRPMSMKPDTNADASWVETPVTS